MKIKININQEDLQQFKNCSAKLDSQTKQLNKIVSDINSTLSYINQLRLRFSSSRNHD